LSFNAGALGVNFVDLGGEVGEEVLLKRVRRAMLVDVIPLFAERARLAVVRGECHPDGSDERRFQECYYWSAMGLVRGLERELRQVRRNLGEVDVPDEPQEVIVLDEPEQLDLV
jgi:hypothetical protein